LASDGPVAVLAGYGVLPNCPGQYRVGLDKAARRQNGGRKKGIRLIDANSRDAYLEGLANEQRTKKGLRLSGPPVNSSAPWQGRVAEFL
jgi:hypothetical protein